MSPILNPARRVEKTFVKFLLVWSKKKANTPVGRVHPSADSRVLSRRLGQNSKAPNLPNSSGP